MWLREQRHAGVADEGLLGQVGKLLATGLGADARVRLGRGARRVRLLEPIEQSAVLDRRRWHVAHYRDAAVRQFRH